VQDYCWDSPASLYTLSQTIALAILARDCPEFIEGFPRIHPIFNPPLLADGPKIQAFALPLSYPGVFMKLEA